MFRTPHKNKPPHSVSHKKKANQIFETTTRSPIINKMTDKRSSSTTTTTTFPMNTMFIHSAFSPSPTPVPSQDWRVRKARLLQILDEVDQLLSE
jgi:hypothetical protein